MFCTKFQPTAVIKEAEVERAFNEPQKWWNTARRAKLLESAVSSKPPSQRRLDALFLRRGGGKWSRLTKRRRARLGWSRRERKRRTRKGERRGYFRRRCVPFQNQSGDNGGGDNSTEAFPPAAYTEDGFRGAKIKISRGETLVWRAPRAP